MLLTPPSSPKPYQTYSPEERIGQILAGCIQLTNVLGVGAYGVVYKAVDLNTGTYYAVKALNKLGLDSRQRSFQEREIQLHHQVSRHPNVVSMVKILDAPDCTFVILEFCPEGDLFSKITEQGCYVGNDILAKQIFLQILDAVEYCHSLGVYHRDLKPEIILDTDNGYTVKLADFGLATRDYLTSDFGCGSTFYMSPECQQSNPRPHACYASPANDVWSLGVILVNLTCGRNPWKRASMDEPTFRAYMRSRSFLKSILPISSELDQILRKVFNPNASQRITVRELRELILQCSYFTEQPAAVAPASPTNGPADRVARRHAQAGQYVAQMPRIPATADLEYSLAENNLANQFSRLSTSSSDSDSIYNYAYSSSSSGAASPVHTAGPTAFTAAQVAAVYTSQALYTQLPWFSQYLHSFNLPKHTALLPPRVF